MTQRRNYFRVKFPITQRPTLVVNTAEFEVVELAETGMRIIVGDAQVSESTGEFEATIHFPDDTSVPVTARVHRREANEAVLRFSANLPYSIIAAQQRRLLKLFPQQAPSTAGASAEKKP